MDTVAATPDRGVLLIGGSFYGHPGAEALLVVDGRIRWIGDLRCRPPEADEAERLALNDRFVLPGFTDAHIHLLHLGLVESGWRIDLANLSRAKTLEALAVAAKERDGDWVVAYGWDESRWDDRRYLTKEEIDRRTMESPVLAIRQDGHLLVANSAALKRVPARAPERWIDRENGWLREEAVGVMESHVCPDETAVRQALDAAAQRCHRLGITSVHSMERVEDLGAFVRGREARRLRVYFCPGWSAFTSLSSVGLQTGFGDEWVRLGGLKIFADGSIGAANAAVSRPYRGGGRGRLNHASTLLRKRVAAADQAGWQTLIHAIGDRSIEQVIRIHEQIRTDASLRHRIEHVELPTPAQLPRMREVGLCASMQPNFIANWSGEGSLYVDRLGADRDARSNPLRAMRDLGIPIAFGSDGMPPSPIYGLHGAVNGPYSEQRLSIEEALSAYTSMGAWFGFDEDHTGALRVGAAADLVVLDKDPTRNAAEVAKRRVERTYVGGELVYAEKDANSDPGPR